jgi:hypothetical protein
VQSVAPTPVLFVDGFRVAVFAGAGVLVAGVVLTALLPPRTAASQAIADAVAEAA